MLRLCVFARTHQLDYTQCLCVKTCVCVCVSQVVLNNNQEIMHRWLRGELHAGVWILIPSSFLCHSPPPHFTPPPL